MVKRKKKFQETTYLVIGDAHVGSHDNEDLSRFTLARNLIVDQKPDQIIIIGDFMDMACLSAWDKDKRKIMEGKRYEKEIAAGNESLDMLENKWPKNYKPHKEFIEGNHSQRISRYLEINPTFDGKINLYKDIKLGERNWHWTDYKQYYTDNEIGFTHVPFDKAKEISGQYVEYKAFNTTIKSVVFGHTHNLATCNRKLEGQLDLQQSLNVGCFFDRDPDYVHGKRKDYWRGLVLLNCWKPGRFDIQTFDLDRLKQIYS